MQGESPRAIPPGHGTRRLRVAAWLPVPTSGSPGCLWLARLSRGTSPIRPPQAASASAPGGS
jgi:hypothetical protein